MSSGRSLVSHWDMSTINPPDLGWRQLGYDGVGSNLVVADVVDGIAGGKALEFNGTNSNVNIGDIVELNAVEKFTIAFWMNQDVIDAIDYIFFKRLDGTHRIGIQTDAAGHMSFIIEDGVNDVAWFDYSTVISANNWHHVAMVFDGTQTGDANRLIVYVDGLPVTLTFNAPIPAATADLTGADAFIGWPSTTFDGSFDEFMIFDAALTNIQVLDLYERTRKGIW